MAKKVRIARHSAFLNLFIFFKSQSGLYASMATFDAKRNVDKGNSKRSRLGGENINIFVFIAFFTELTKFVSIFFLARINKFEHG